MADISGRVGWRLAQAIKGGSDADHPKEGTCEVVSRDGEGTVWVRLPGNDFDTPVNGGTLASVAAGDSVRYRIEGGRLTILGNGSNPSASTSSVAALASVTERQGEYVMEHLMVTPEGLWVLPNGKGQAATPQGGRGYKALLANSGMTIYDSSGRAVSTFGESITLSSNRPQYIGGEDAYIVFHDTDTDGVPDAITIGGRVVMGTGESLSELLAGVSYDHTFGETATTYDFRAHAYRGGIDVTDEFDPDCFGWWLRTESGDEWLGSGVTMSVLKSRVGYRASVVGGLTVATSAELADGDGNGIVDGEGDTIAMLAVG